MKITTRSVKPDYEYWPNNAEFEINADIEKEWIVFNRKNPGSSYYDFRIQSVAKVKNHLSRLEITDCVVYISDFPNLKLYFGSNESFMLFRLSWEESND